MLNFVDSLTEPLNVSHSLLALLSELPPLPDVAAQAIVLVDRPSTTTVQLEILLGRDPGLATHVLRVANSPVFARAKAVTTLTEAVSIIGFKALKGIILAATLRGLGRKATPCERMLWANSSCTAICSRLLAAEVNRTIAEEAFIFGLLHDLGKLALLRQLPERYVGIWEHTREGVTFHDAESQQLQYTHPLVGALMAQRWNFSPETCQVILNHHATIEGEARSEVEQCIQIVQAANAVSHMLGHGHPEGYPDHTPVLERALRNLGVSGRLLPRFVDETAALYREQQSLLG